MSEGMSPGLINYPWDVAPERGTVTKVADGVLWARLPLPMALDHVNIYFLREDNGWAMVDTGFNTSLTREIFASLREGPLGGDPITRLLCTHHHPDHIGLAGLLQAEGTELLMTRTAWVLGRMLTLDVEDSYTPEALEFYHRNGMAAEVLEARKSERPFNFADRVAPMPVGYTRIKEGEEIIFGGRRWSVACGNGHAPEHAVLYEVGGDHLVLGGDQLLPSISPNIGVYPTEPEADPVGEWLESCARLAPLARSEHLVLPGHKLPYRGLPKRMEQLADNHHGALARLKDHLSEPRIGGECFAPLFKREVTREIYGLALVEAIAHLNHLWKRGDVTRRLKSDGVFEWQAVEGT